MNIVFRNVLKEIPFCLVSLFCFVFVSLFLNTQTRSLGEKVKNDDLHFNETYNQTSYSPDGKIRHLCVFMKIIPDIVAFASAFVLCPMRL